MLSGHLTLLVARDLQSSGKACCQRDSCGVTPEQHLQLCQCTFCEEVFEVLLWILSTESCAGCGAKGFDALPGPQGAARPPATSDQDHVQVYTLL